MQSFLYENITIIHQANIMQVPCKMMQKANVFVFFELNEIKRKIMALQPPNSARTIQTTPKQSTKVKET